MQRSTVLLAAGFVLAASTAFAAEGTFDKTLSVSGTPNVSVNTGSGYLHVYPGSGNQVHIIGHVHARAGMFGGDADAKVKEIVANPPITQSGAEITVGSNHGDSNLFQNVSIDYDVTVPAATALKAHSGSGNVEIGGIQGVVNAGSGSGEVKVDNIGANARLETGSGSIHAINVHGAASLETGSGNLELGLSGPGDVKAQTGSGSIHIRGLNGGLRAGTGSGSLEVDGTPTSEWRLETGSGSILVEVGRGAKFTVNAGTGSGSIHVDQPMVMQGSMNRHHVTATVNGGGPTLRANTGSGDITIR
jgi:hypothetical protein